jgi:NADPH2:quinone reductase
MTYTATPADFRHSAGRVIDMVTEGSLKIEVHQTYPLKEAAEAHRALEGRRTTGSTVLIP